jgi:hypothetical protein
MNCAYVPPGNDYTLLYSQEQREKTHGISYCPNIQYSIKSDHKAVTERLQNGYS